MIMKLSREMRIGVLVVSVLLLSLGAFADSQAKKATKKAVGRVTDANQRRFLAMKNPLFGEATQAFRDGKYASALTQFESLDKNGCCCDMVHYYIAQCYHHLNQVKGAQMHYQWVTTYSQDSQLRNYSQVATAQLGYYNNHRTYSGNGNNFSKFTGGGASSGGTAGGGGRVRFG